MLYNAGILGDRYFLIWYWFGGVDVVGFFGGNLVGDSIFKVFFILR